MRTLITGYTGFVGSNLIQTLNKDSVFGVDIVKTDVQKHFYWNELNMCKDIDCIIHLAGKAHDTKNTTEEQSYFEVNTGLTKTIFDFFLKSEAKKFIFFSSVKTVADTVNAKKLTEDIIPHPQTPYGKSKLAAENYILSQELPTDKQVYILRPSMIHGPGNKGNLNLLYKLVQKGIPWPLGAFKNKRSFTSIDNLSFIIQQIIQKEIKPGIYQIADDEPLATNRLIELISESRKGKAHIWNINPKIISACAKLGDVLHLPLNSERLKKLTESYVVSNNKIKEALRIEELPMTAEDGMKKTLASFK